MDTVEMNAIENGRMSLASLILGLGVSSLDINHDLGVAVSVALRLTAGQRLYVDYFEPHGPTPKDGR
jgi:hypothetical protein